MRLVIVRHATALPRGTPGVPDPDRPLTPRGVKRFTSAARGLARALPRPDAILTSPWKRARQTARILAEAWKGPEPKISDALAGGDRGSLARALLRHRDATVAVVGHEPWLSDLLAHLLGSSKNERLEFRKGGVAVVDFDGGLEGPGRLVAYLPPRLMRRLR